MSQQQILQSAHEGDPNAIALLLNQALKAKQVQAHLILENHHLYITLDSPTVPDQAASIRVIKKGLLRLQAESIWGVTIAANQQNTHKNPAWIHTVLLKSSSTVAVATPKTPPASPKNSAVSFPKKSKKAPPKKTVKPEKVVPIPAKAQKLKLKLPKSLSFIGLVCLTILPISGLIVGVKWDRISASLATIPPTFATASQTVLGQIPNLLISPTSTDNNPITVDPLLSQATIDQVRYISDSALSSLDNPIDPNMRITIKSVGDIIPGTNYPYNKLHPQKQVLFAGVKTALQDADIVFGNFESTLTNYPRSAKDVSRGLVFAFRTPPEYTSILKDAGFDILSVANNHSFDFFETGFNDTIANIEKAGMKAVGKKDQIVYHDVKGLRTAFIGFSYFNYHNNLNDLEASKALVEKAAENSDIVVVSIHAGAEGTRALRTQNQIEYFYGENRGNKVLFSRTMIDAGADMVLGHGPHVPRALELYNGKLIAYSLGNFLGYRTLSTQVELGYSLVLETQLDPVGNFVGGKIIPVHLNSQGIPSIDNSFRSVGLIQRLTKSDFPDTPLEIDKQGNIVVSQPSSPSETVVISE